MMIGRSRSIPNYYDDQKYFFSNKLSPKTQLTVSSFHQSVAILNKDCNDSIEEGCWMLDAGCWIRILNDHINSCCLQLALFSKTTLFLFRFQRLAIIICSHLKLLVIAIDCHLHIRRYLKECRRFFYTILGMCQHDNEKSLVLVKNQLKSLSK